MLSLFLRSWRFLSGWLISSWPPFWSLRLVFHRFSQRSYPDASDIQFLPACSRLNTCFYNNAQGASLFFGPLVSHLSKYALVLSPWLIQRRLLALLFSVLLSIWSTVVLLSGSSLGQKAAATKRLTSQYRGYPDWHRQTRSYPLLFTKVFKILASPRFRLLIRPILLQK